MHLYANRVATQPVWIRTQPTASTGHTGNIRYAA